MQPEILSSIKEYNEDESYIEKIVYKKTNSQEYLSEIKNYSKDNINYSGKTFIDENFIELDYSYIKEYNEDGSYIEKVIQEIPNIDGNIACIREYNCNHKLINSKYYSDKEFKECITLNAFENIAE